MASFRSALTLKSATKSVVAGKNTMPTAAAIRWGSSSTPVQSEPKAPRPIDDSTSALDCTFVLALIAHHIEVAEDAANPHRIVSLHACRQNDETSTTSPSRLLAPSISYRRGGRHQHPLQHPCSFSRTVQEVRRGLVTVRLVWRSDSS